ncbi:MAG TPA: hypothetical protein DD414_01205, partial [Lachnospiraceae bacterium]|nr:hypothetical protein [Lachnospiraceae bacterium]
VSCKPSYIQLFVPVFVLAKSDRDFAFKKFDRRRDTDFCFRYNKKEEADGFPGTFRYTGNEIVKIQTHNLPLLPPWIASLFR